jgi:hypothetical protein
VNETTPAPSTLYVPTPATATVVTEQFGDTSTGEPETSHNFTDDTLNESPGAALSLPNKFFV